MGDSHPLAKLTDEEVQALLVLKAEGWGYRRLAAKFEISKRSVRDYCKGTRRAGVATSFKIVEVRVTQR